MRPTLQQLKSMVADAEAQHARRRAHGSPRHINVRAIVAREVAGCCRRVAPEHIREPMRLRADLGFDDLDIVALALALEAKAEMHRRLDLSDCESVADVVCALARALGTGLSSTEEDE